MWKPNKDEIIPHPRTFLIGILLCCALSLNVAASNHTWKSTGNVSYQDKGVTVTAFNKEDLDYLDTRISSIESNVDSYKTSVADKINEWSIPEDRKLSSSSTFADINNILEYIKGIPNVGSPVVDDVNNQVYLKSDGSITTNSSEAKLDEYGNPCTVIISACESSNMSAGSTAWVNGNVVIGNGNDNKAYYNLGYTDGISKINNSSIKYIYHQHKDKDGNVVTASTMSSYGGCYTNRQPVNETIQVRRSRVAYDPGCNQDNSWGNCPRCGEIYTGWKRPGNSWDSDYVSHTHTIGYAYGIGCGKSTSTIESAVINM